MAEPVSQLQASGALPNPDTLLWVGRGIAELSGMRVIDIAPAGGISVRVLPDRGLDLGQAWYQGIPLAWLSKIGEHPPLQQLDGMAWSDAFGGGLMTTCGLRNVGLPSEGHGLHGTFSHQPATDVDVRQLLDGPGAVRVTGRVVDADREPELTVDRMVTTWADEGRIEVEDVTTNTGATVAEAPLLYHLNFGYPIWSGPAFIELDVIDTQPRDPESARFGRWDTPPPIRVGPEAVFEHHVESIDGRGRARVVNPDMQIEVLISWATDQLPIVNQWIDANPGMGVLGVEPANCTTRGIAFERANGSLPMIEPGHQRSTSVKVEVRTL